MSRTIWRYSLPLTDSTTIDMPGGAIPISVGPFRAPDGRHFVDPPLDLWALVDPDQPLKPYTFHVVGTGNPIPTEPSYFLGTTHSHHGALIWHVFAAHPAPVRLTPETR